jgi:hypothetical protein
LFPVYVGAATVHTMVSGSTWKHCLPTIGTTLAPILFKG